MHRLIAAFGIAILTTACGAVAPGPSTAYRPGPYPRAPEPECMQATPGNSLDGFRCTGDYAGSESGKR